MEHDEGFGMHLRTSGRRTSSGANGSASRQACLPFPTVIVNTRRNQEVTLCQEDLTIKDRQKHSISTPPLWMGAPAARN